MLAPDSIETLLVELLPAEDVTAVLREVGTGAVEVRRRVLVSSVRLVDEVNS